MTPEPRHRVTRGYVAMLIFGVAAIAAALTVAAWGLLALALQSEPVSTSGSPRWLAPLAIALALVLLGWTLWRQAIVMLRGRRSPAWGYWLLAGVGAYAVWVAIGSLIGLESAETWGSPFALLLVPIWIVASLFFWALLVRRLYTDRGRPRWPWERDDDLGPDWANYGLDPWHGGPAGDPGPRLDGENESRADDEPGADDVAGADDDGSNGSRDPRDGRG